MTYAWPSKLHYLLFSLQGLPHTLQLPLQPHAYHCLDGMEVSASKARSPTSRAHLADWFFTVYVPMFGIDKNPIKSTPCDGPSLITPRKHLPCSECESGGCPQGLLKSVRCLHHESLTNSSVRMKCYVNIKGISANQLILRSKSSVWRLAFQWIWLEVCSKFILGGPLRRGFCMTQPPVLAWQLDETVTCTGDFKFHYHILP